MAAHNAALMLAQAHGRCARFAEMLQVCGDIADAAPQDVEAQLDVGALLLHFGFLTRARACFERVRLLAPLDPRPVVNLANLFASAGHHAESRRLYAALLRQMPDHPVVRRNAILSLEYDPAVSDAERLAQAKAWGDWAVMRAGGPRPRPAGSSGEGRPLRVGYVSADVCQHTVGLFVKDVLTGHDKARAMPFVYSAGTVHDWVSEEISRACEIRRVAGLNDLELSQRIREDRIDVLVDLSGHTAGSRLAMFAHRPAAVQVSWLGYFATTGLDCMDAVLLDDWHAPPGAEAHFVESVARLAAGRWCYRPVPWAPPDVGSLPMLESGSVTFGSFNNTSKLNEAVLDVWSDVLKGVANSRLVIKWRTLADQELRREILGAFQTRGVDPERIELRGASFHADLLQEYADIDIALDPFPFTGGLTSCEALWMGVPVVTWPQSRVVSRQTFALLSAIGIPDLAAGDAADYVRIAADLAGDRGRLAALRRSLRERMRTSPLMDVPAFTRELEARLIDLYRSKTVATSGQAGTS